MERIIRPDGRQRIVASRRRLYREDVCPRSMTVQYGRSFSPLRDRISPHLPNYVRHRFTSSVWFTIIVWQTNVFESIFGYLARRMCRWHDNLKFRLSSSWLSRSKSLALGLNMPYFTCFELWLEDYHRQSSRMLPIQCDRVLCIFTLPDLWTVIYREYNSRSNFYRQESPKS